MSCQDAIGVFDSGLGGLSAVKEFLHVLPNEKIIYFGDTGRVPYGNRSRETISKYALQDANFLLKHNDRKTKNGKIGIIGTAATISSHSYKLRLEKLNPKYKVYEQACPLFVPLVENGFICRDDQIVRLVIRRYLSELKETGVDTLILGCTHYPLLRDAIADFMGDGVTLVDSGYETAIYCSKILRENNLLNTDGVRQTPEFYVSDTPDGFKSVAGLFLGRNMEHTVTQIDIEQY